MDLATMRARVREDLQDTDAANYRWTDDEVDGAIERVVREFSLAYPLQQQDEITTTADDKELDISILSSLLKIVSVEYPMDLTPPCMQRFDFWNDKLYMRDEGDGTKKARVRWGRQHVLGAAWQASTAYSWGAFVWPTTFNGYKYVCTTAGTSHATTEPTWPTTLGQTVTDGTTLVWTCHSVEAVVTFSTIPTEHEEIIVMGAAGYLAISASAYTVDKASIGGRYASPDFLKWGRERLSTYNKKLKAIASRVTTRELYSD